MRHPQFLHVVAVAAAVFALPFAVRAEDLPPVKQVSIVRKLNPIYPYDLLLKGKTGVAEVRFMVDYSGKPTMTTIASASAPAFGHALLADIESNEFMPPRINGQPQITLSGEKYTFDENSLDPAEKRVLAELRKPSPGIVPTAELDKPLTPVRREPPTFPMALQAESTSGRAEIEFVVDREGHAVLPRVLNASHEDFGWAAATGVSHWRYQPPTKGGQKVDARTTVIITFDGAKGSVSFP